jgi:ribosomal protein L35AE/L33A
MRSAKDVVRCGDRVIVVNRDDGSLVDGTVERVQEGGAVVRATLQRITSKGTQGCLARVWVCAHMLDGPRPQQKAGA